MIQIIRVKICGIRSLEEALWAVEAGADALGFILVPQSKRYIEPERLREITAQLPPFISKTGVFVNESPNRVANVVRQCSLDTIQLHGDEEVRLYQGVPAVKIKTVSFDPEAAIIRPSQSDPLKPKTFEEQLKNLQSELTQGFIHAVLLDAQINGQSGGTGVPLPWNHVNFQTFLHQIKQTGCPVILAGGLRPDNVQDAIQQTLPYGVDVSSGVERNGRKDRFLIDQFIKRAKKTSFKM